MASQQHRRVHRWAAVITKRRPARHVSGNSIGPAEASEEVPGPQAQAAEPAAVQVAVARSRWGRRRVLKWSLGIAALVVIGYVGWVAYALIGLESRIIKPLPPTPTANVASVTTPAATTGVVQQVSLSSPTPDPLRALLQGRINILVLGTDKRPNDPDHFARSDTLILANLDTTSKTVRVMTIPRDLIVDIPGYGKNKVNAAYLFGEYYKEPGGGQALSVRSISQLFDVPIDYYLTVNFDGFRKLVDTLGGVQIDVPYALDDYNYPSDDEGDPFGDLHVHFDGGLQDMDGKQALRYVRTRHADNDFMRSKRQLQVIMALRHKAMSVNLIPTLPTLIDQLGGMVETNIPFDQQLALAQFGYGIEPSKIITSTIDREMITPSILPDGSEGLELDWVVAGPMVDAFFGRTSGTSLILSQQAAVGADKPPTARPKVGQVNPNRATPIAKGTPRTPRTTSTRVAAP